MSTHEHDPKITEPTSAEEAERQDMEGSSDSEQPEVEAHRRTFHGPTEEPEKNRVKYIR